MALDPSFDIIARWNGADPKHAALLREAGVTVALLEESATSLAAACRSAGMQTPPSGAIQFLNLNDLGNTPPNAVVALRNGLWPGITRGPNAADDETATAAMLSLSGQGNVHTTTARAFDASEIDKVVALLGK